MTKALLVAGLGFGDEGKGTTTEWLVQKYNAPLVVRYNGGAQAAHNVVTDDGRHHTFSQFGSGTFLGAGTYLSRFMLIDPLALLAEAAHLQQVGVPKPLEGLFVDRDAPLITPYHRAANRAKELARGGGKHGSCGVGIGECMAELLEFGRYNVPVVRDLECWQILVDKLRELQNRKIRQIGDIEPSSPIYPLLYRNPATLAEQYIREFGSQVKVVEVDYLEKISRSRNIVFEGAQGVLLDQDFGLQPYTTWTDITYNNAEALLRYIGYTGEMERWGVIRSYMTRHGAGPMPTEDTEWGARGEKHNRLDAWQGGFRAGLLDIPLLKYAVKVVGGIHKLAVTHMDQAPASIVTNYNPIVGCSKFMTTANDIAVRRPVDLKYQTDLANFLTHQDAKFYIDDFRLSSISMHLKAPIGMLSCGPRLMDKKDPLAWGVQYNQVL